MQQRGHLKDRHKGYLLQGGKPIGSNKIWQDVQDEGDIHVLLPLQGGGHKRGGGGQTTNYKTHIPKVAKPGKGSTPQSTPNEPGASSSPPYAPAPLIPSPQPAAQRTLPTAPPGLEEQTETPQEENLETGAWNSSLWTKEMQANLIKDTRTSLTMHTVHQTP